MDEFRRVYAPPDDRAGLKVLDRLDVHCRSFIALPPYLCDRVRPRRCVAAGLQSRALVSIDKMVRGKLRLYSPPKPSRGRARKHAQHA